MVSTSEVEKKIKDELLKSLTEKQKELSRTHGKLTTKLQKDRDNETIKNTIDDIKRDITFNFEERNRLKRAREDAIVVNRRDMISNLLDVKVSLEEGIEKYPGNQILRGFVAQVNQQIDDMVGDDLEIVVKKAQKLKNDINEYKLDLDHKHHITMDKTIGNGEHFAGLREASMFERNGKKYAKIWLLNAQNINGNGWGVSGSTLDTNIMKFIGRPYVVTAQDFLGKQSPYGNQMVHPSLPTMNMTANLQHQEQFRVGTIVDIIKDGTEYYAQIEIKDQYRNHSLPPFCSPAVFQADLREPETNFSKWDALHLAGLSEKPAYGARIAILKGTCVGTQGECKVQFKKAQLEAKTICASKQAKLKTDIKILSLKIGMLKLAEEFKESEHPRSEDGKFTSGNNKSKNIKKNNNKTITPEDSNKIIDALKKHFPVVKEPKDTSKVFLTPDGEWIQLNEGDEHWIVLPAVTEKHVNKDIARNLPVKQYLSHGLIRGGFEKGIVFINGEKPLNSKQKEVLELTMIKKGLTSDNLITEFHDENYDNKLKRLIKTSQLKIRLSRRMV